MLEFEEDDDMVKMWRYLNPFCTKNCLTLLREGKLQCNCGEIGVYDWRWDVQDDTNVLMLKNNIEIVFHPVYSSGTAVLRGKEPFKKNMHHYWEVKMMTSLYGTDVMVGVGTSRITLADWKFRFCSILGLDEESFGYSYNGKIQHNKQTRTYGSKFGLGSLIGVHLDMCTGKLEYYLNRKPLGVAFQNLKSLELYPMVSSTAAQSVMKMTCSISVPSTLQLNCLQKIIKDPELYEEFRKIPGLARIYERKYFWLLPRTEDDPKRKTDLESFLTETKRRKVDYVRCILTSYRQVTGANHLRDGVSGVSLQLLHGAACKTCDILSLQEDDDSDD